MAFLTIKENIMTYSADFRNKVVQLFNSGSNTADLCAQFHISRSILY